MNILMIGNDYDAFLGKENVLLKRLEEYSKFSNIFYVNFTPGYHFQDYKTNNIAFYFLNSRLIPLNLIKLFRISAELIKYKKINIITTQDPFLGMLGVLLKLLFKRPLNIQLHQDIIDNVYWLRESKRNHLLNFIGKITLRFADTLRVVSSRIKKNLIKKNKISEEKIAICPIYVDTFNYLHVKPEKKVLEEIG